MPNRASIREQQRREAVAAACRRIAPGHRARVDALAFRGRLLLAQLEDVAGVLGELERESIVAT